MFKNNEIVRCLEILGVFVIFILAVFLHNLYAKTKNPIFMPISPVNESVWEHLKMMFFAALFYALFEYFIGLKYNSNFIFAKGISLLIIPFFITAIFYGYTAILGRNYLIIDIILTFITAFVSQSVSYKILSSIKDYSTYSIMGFLIIITMIIIFTIFTYYPPNLKIFISNE